MSKSKKMHQRILPFFFNINCHNHHYLYFDHHPTSCELGILLFLNNGCLSIGVEYLNTKLANQTLSRSLVLYFLSYLSLVVCGLQCRPILAHGL